MKRNYSLTVMLLVAIVFAGYSKTVLPEKEPVKALVYLTAKGTNELLSKQESAAFFDFPQPTESIPCIYVDNSKTFQTIVGIGGALTDASGETFFKLPKDKQNEIITAYFDKEKGIGYSLGRTHINSCDFSSGSYAYTETAGDTSLSKFSIQHDLKYRIPLIKLAIEKTGGDIKLFASPWSPPAWMKTNNDMLHGGSLKHEYYPAWANYYIRFFEEYKKQGINFWGLTIQNEPLAVQSWESCVYTAEEERDFLRDYLGPKLVKSQFADTKVIIWDHNRNFMYRRSSVVLDDPEASRYVWGTGFHWYSGNQYDNEKMLHDAYPSKAMMMTEGCLYPFKMDSVNNWRFGEIYGESLINDFNNWAAGWTDWNILLDETGGPNHVKNFCYAPVIADTKTGKVYYMASFYYLGHFSKFVRPGAKRIVATTSTDNLLTTAFANPDGSIAVVVMNKSDKSLAFNLCLDRKAARLTSPAHSIITSIIPLDD